ncbi:hypothetical protein WMY93_024396 [Mugilogobius chulae]|uniref:Uncharacterized protein n=1 Tax=Mugilogobius chulae TaxID=88201 RepID=A0AAW0MZJ1_9GOBI
MPNGGPEQSEFPSSLPLSPAASSPVAISSAANHVRSECPAVPDNLTTMLSEFSALRQLLNERADAMETLVNQNSVVIAELKAEERVEELETQTTASKKTTADLGSSISLLESYSRRWNLILHGLEERDRQDVRQEAIQVLQRVLPEARDKLPDVVDTVHRLGARRPNSSRSVIIQFSLRLYRDAIWRAAKQSTFLSSNNLKLTEDLSSADRERRRQLWPLVESARKNNKLAFFKGGRAFVDGTEIFPP